MIIRARSKDTGLSRDYILETTSFDAGNETHTHVVARSADGYTFGSWVNPRQDAGDNRPLYNILISDDVPAMEELLNYFGGAPHETLP